MLIEPAWSGIGRLERSLPQQRAQAAELESLLGEVKGLKSQPQVATVSSAEVKGAIETSLGRAGLKLTRMVPLSEGDIQLTFTNVPYGAWATWLAGIERELGARATSVVVTGKEGNARQRGRRAGTALGAQMNRIDAHGLLPARRARRTRCDDSGRRAGAMAGRQRCIRRPKVASNWQKLAAVSGMGRPCWYWCRRRSSRARRAPACRSACPGGSARGR